MYYLYVSITPTFTLIYMYSLCIAYIHMLISILLCTYTRRIFGLITGGAGAAESGAVANSTGAGKYVSADRWLRQVGSYTEVERGQWA